MCYDIEGRRFDIGNEPGKVKAMGIDTQRSDTPKPIQDFLGKVLMMAEKQEYDILEIGILTPKPVKKDKLAAGEVGYLI